MKKSKYELLLSNDLMERIDYIAKRMATSRSATVNRLLGERLEMSTPEGRYDALYEEFERFFSAKERDLELFRSLHNDSVILINRGQSVYYEVVIEEREGTVCGEIYFICRSTSPLIKQRFQTFFNVFRLIEERHLPWNSCQKQSELVYVRAYRLLDGLSLLRVRRYVGIVDRLLKGYLTGVYEKEELEQEFMQCLSEAEWII